jgi:microcystin-dependent protein
VNTAANNFPGRAINGAGNVNVYTTTPSNAQFNPFAIGITGSSQPHNNDMPTLVLNFCIALQGVYPPRT